MIRPTRIVKWCSFPIVTEEQSLIQRNIIVLGILFHQRFDFLAGAATFLKTGQELKLWGTLAHGLDVRCFLMGVCEMQPSNNFLRLLTDGIIFDQLESSRQKSLEPASIFETIYCNSYFINFYKALDRTFRISASRSALVQCCTVSLSSWHPTEKRRFLAVLSNF